MSRPNLSVVTDQGELIEDPALEIRRLQDEVMGLKRDVRAWHYRYAELARDKEQEAMDHKLWPAAVELFAYWKQVCKHPQTEWMSDRFWIVLPFLKKYGFYKCKAAIAGAAYDHYSDTRRNGTAVHYNEWHRIFSAKDFDRFLASIPEYIKEALDRYEKNPSEHRNPQQNLIV